MKKTILLLVLVAIGITSLAATKQRTILSHKGVLTQYDANHWQEAIADAVAGDTVFFTSGNFVGNFTITKPITLIGAGMADNDVYWKDSDMAAAYEGCATTGESTLLEGVTITIPGSPTLTSTMLEGLRLTGISVTDPLNNLSIKRCHIMYYNDSWKLWYGGFGSSAQLTNLQLESCIVAHIDLTNFVNPDIHNCYILKIEPSPEEIEFVNCAIMDIWGTSNCTFINSIVHFATGSDNTCINCIYDDAYPNQAYFDSWLVGGANTMSKSQLEAGGYIGNDGTVVGPLGGTAPFTLVPSQPYISSSNITYNKTTGKLNVNLTVKKGQ